MPAPIRIRRCWSSSMARVRSPATTATSSSMPCAAALRVIAPDLPHYGMSGPGNLDKNPARIHAGHARRRARPRGQPARRQEGVLSRPLARRPGRAGLRAELAGSGAGTDPRSACGTGGVPARESRSGPGKTARCSTRRSAATSTKWKQIWDQTGILTERNRAYRAEHPRLLLFQEARSGDWRRVEVQERLLHERQRVCPLPYRAARRPDQGQSEGARAVVERLHLRHLRHGGRSCRRTIRRTSTSGSTQIKAPIFLAFGAKEPFIPGTGLQRPEGPRGRHHRSVHDAHDGCRQPANREDLSGHRALHSHGQPGGIRDRCRRLRDERHASTSTRRSPWTG